MKEIYKAIDGKLFERKGDCLKYEFELKGGKNHFENEVKEALEYLEENHSLTFNIIEIDASIDWDGDPNSDKMNFVEWQTIELEVFSNGNQIGDAFSRGSNNGGYTKDKIIEDIVNSYVIPYNRVFEGYVNDNDDYYSSYKIGNVDIDTILQAMYGKKIRIEVVED